MDIFSKYPIYNFVSNALFPCARKELRVHSEFKLNHKLRENGGIKH